MGVLFRVRRKLFKMAWASGWRWYEKPLEEGAFPSGQFAPGMSFRGTGLLWGSQDAEYAFHLRDDQAPRFVLVDFKIHDASNYCCCLPSFDTFVPGAPDPNAFLNSKKLSSQPLTAFDRVCTPQLQRSSTAIVASPSLLPARNDPYSPIPSLLSSPHSNRRSRWDSTPPPNPTPNPSPDLPHHLPAALSISLALISDIADQHYRIPHHSKEALPCQSCSKRTDAESGFVKTWSWRLLSHLRRGIGKQSRYTMLGRGVKSRGGGRGGTKEEEVKERTERDGWCK